MERKAAVERVRREEGRQSVEEVDALAQGARYAGVDFASPSVYGALPVE